MSNLITLPVAPRERLRELHRYGSATGLRVALMLDTDPGAHLPLRLAAIGPEPIGAATLASFLRSAEGRRTANKVAVSVLRALQRAGWTIPEGEA